MKAITRILFTTICICTVSAATAQSSAGIGPYTDNPLVEFLARQRFHVMVGVQADTASNDHDVMSLLAGVGAQINDYWSAGAYGTVRGSDRSYPYRMKQMYGVGVYSEYNFTPDAVLQPFGGLRLGFVDTTGPGNPTSLTAAALGGLKLAFGRNLSLSAAGVFNWAQDDILDYNESDDGRFTSENHDISVEIGLRFGF